MPFHQPFARRIDRRDLCYGLAGPRQNYTDNNVQFSGGVDLINNYRISKEEQNRRPVPPEREPEFLQAVKAHPKYSSILGAELDTNEVIRRKCKAGLHWGTHSSDGAHIHFILDSLNQNAIVDKNYRDDFIARSASGSIIKERSITNAELRWLFRNRNDPNVQNRVQFWQNGEPTYPPWETDPSTWAQYRPGTPRRIAAPGDDTMPREYEAFPLFNSAEAAAHGVDANPAATIRQGGLDPEPTSQPEADIGDDALVQQFIRLCESDEED